MCTMKIPFPLYVISILDAIKLCVVFTLNSYRRDRKREIALALVVI